MKRSMTCLVAALGTFAFASVAMAQSSLPNPQLTPGAINPNVNQSNINQTICVRGWTATVRPDESYTETLKKQQIRQYGYSDMRLRDYEEDHLIPLELGGSPTSPRNLWPQPRHPSDGWTAAMKDQLENGLSRMVCRGEIGLDNARSAIASDWRRAYQMYIGQ
jgi:hypothetical protein